jgi:hypothetical protein
MYSYKTAALAAALCSSWLPIQAGEFRSAGDGNQAPRSWWGQESWHNQRHQWSPLSPGYPAPVGPAEVFPQGSSPLGTSSSRGRSPSAGDRPHPLGAYPNRGGRTVYPWRYAQPIHRHVPHYPDAPIKPYPVSPQYPSYPLFPLTWPYQSW